MPRSGDLGRLSALQRAVLAKVADFEPPPRLTGGAALAAAHLGHRETRDLDLFWRERDRLGDLAVRLEGHLRAGGITDIHVVTQSAGFVRWQVRDGEYETLVDLVAEPMPAVADGVPLDVAGHIVVVDSAHEILVNKLVALMSRSELRDLIDAEALVANGGDLVGALQAGPSRDAGFSAPVLAWVVEQMPIEALASREGMDEAAVQRLVAFKTRLLSELAQRGPAT